VRTGTSASTGERDVAKRAGREQLLDAQHALAQALLVGVLQERLE